LLGSTARGHNVRAGKNIGGGFGQGFVLPRVIGRTGSIREAHLARAFRR